MGKLFGKRPDRTGEIERRIQRQLKAGERLVAGVHVQRPGTNFAAMAGGASGAVGATMGLPPRIPDQDPAERERWLAEVTAVGAGDRAGRAIQLIVALTTHRLLLIRCGRVGGRPREVMVAWPVAQVESIEVPRNGSTLVLNIARESLTLELPLAHKFLPDVYRRLPRLLDEVRSADAQ